MNLLTEIDLHLYSGEMTSEFQLLSEKIDQLAKLTQSLRRENAELRLNNVALTSANADLSLRMQEARQRVSTLLNNIPGNVQDEEAA